MRASNQERTFKKAYALELLRIAEADLGTAEYLLEGLGDDLRARDRSGMIARDHRSGWPDPRRVSDAGGAHMRLT